MTECGNSCPVRSPQTGVHPGLLTLLARRRDHHWQRPLRPAPAWWPRVGALLESGVALQLDLGCGTGASTAVLAARHPQSLVLGIDASIDRLTRGIGRDCLRATIDPSAHDSSPTASLRAAACARIAANAWLLHGDSVDLVQRLAAIRDLRIARCWLLYPNPWPKTSHLARRWYAHPVFPQLLALSETLELRCNWRPFAEDFVAATRWLGRSAVLQSVPADVAPLTPFERKYRASDHTLWQVQVRPPSPPQNAEGRIAAASG